MITVPGSKSYTNRALLLAALCNGTSRLEGTLLSDDARVMIDALKHLGIDIQEDGTTLIVTSKGHFTPPKKPLYLGNAGTAVRFLTAILSNQTFRSEIEGDARMKERPIQDLIDALTSIGANIESTDGCPPLTIHESQLTGGKVTISGHNSSQYISALMMLAPLLNEGLTINIEGEATSKPYLDMTLDLMNKFCVQKVSRNGYKSFLISHQKYQPTELVIEADTSSATYFFGLAAITGKKIKVAHLTQKTLQPDIQILDHLEAMGCTIKEDKTGISVTGPEILELLGTIHANDFPDGAMTLATVAAFAPGETRLTGLHNLRIKESDRLSAMATELTKMGALTTEHDDGLTIQGNPDALHGATIETYNDHRIAMCFGMASARIPNLKIQNPDCVHKTYPLFWDDLKKAIK